MRKKHAINDDRLCGLVSRGRTRRRQNSSTLAKAYRAPATAREISPRRPGDDCPLSRPIAATTATATASVRCAPKVVAASRHPHPRFRQTRWSIKILQMRRDDAFCLRASAYRARRLDLSPIQLELDSLNAYCRARARGRATARRSVKRQTIAGRRRDNNRPTSFDTPPRWPWCRSRCCPPRTMRPGSAAHAAGL